MATHLFHTQDYIYPQPWQYYKIWGILSIVYWDAHISDYLIGRDIISGCTYAITTIIYSNYPLMMLGCKCLTHKWMWISRIKQNNYRVLVHKKRTRSNNFIDRNFFNSGIVHMSLTHIGITLLLVVLLGIGAISCPMARLVAVPTWQIARWNIGTSLSCAALW